MYGRTQQSRMSPRPMYRPGQPVPTYTQGAPATMRPMNQGAPATYRPAYSAPARPAPARSPYVNPQYQYRPQQGAYMTNARQGVPQSWRR